MAIPSRQIGWSTEDNLLWQISKQLEQLTNVTAKTCATNAPTYKVFTALLTQSGVDDPDTLSSGTLTKGVSYQFSGTGGTDVDFSNLGVTNPVNGEWFIATQTAAPINWDGWTVSYNIGAPVANVLENTIGSIYFEYANVGNYIVNSLTNLFTSNKTTVNSETFYCSPSLGIGSMYPSQILTDTITIESRAIATNTNRDDILNAILFEIRVYN